MREHQISRRRFALVFGVAYLLHLVLLAYALPVEVVFGDRPFASPDYQTHYEQSSTLSEVVDRFGRFWAYDPHLLAGHPVGLIFDVDNKLHFLFTYGLTKLGVPRPIAFNLFTLLTGLLAPLSIWLAARLFSVGRRAELWTLGFAVLIWHFDSATRFCWTAGMVSFATVGHLSILILGLFHQLIREGRWRWWVALLILLPIALLTHVWAFTTLVVPMVGLYLWRWRQHQLGRRHHLQVWTLALFALLVNLYWLLPALQHFGFISPSGIVGQANPLYILSDWLELLISPINTGFIMPQTMLRFAAICGAVLVLWRWRRQGDQRLLLVALTLGWLYGMAYFASLIPGVRETEPYRFIIPATLMTVVVGSIWWAEALRWQALRALPAQARVLLVVALVLLVPRLAGGVFYFLPEFAPQSRLPPLIVDQTRTPPISTSGYPRVHPNPQFLPQSWRLRGIGDDLIKLARFLDEECKEPGRALVQHWAVGEMLRWASRRPIIGGFPDRRVAHEAAYLFRRPDDPRFWGKNLADYLLRYNVRYLVMTDPIKEVERRRDLIEPKRLIGPHRVYRVRHLGNYFAAGSGRVKADLNRIEVVDAKPASGTQRLTLRFHHMRTLRCRPGCRVVKEKIPHDPVGFITVVGEPTLPERFVIEHRY